MKKKKKKTNFVLQLNKIIKFYILKFQKIRNF